MCRFVSMCGIRTRFTARILTHIQEVRSMPDLSEARSSWLKAKAEHKRAQLRALEQDKERQAVEVLKQQVVLKRHQGMHRQGGTRRLKQQEEVLQLPSAQPSEKGYDQLERRNLSHVPLRLVCSTSIVDTGEIERGKGWKEKRDQTDYYSDQHTTALTVAPRVNPPLFHALLATSSPAPSTSLCQIATPNRHIAASSFSITSCSRALDMYRSPNKRQCCSSLSPSSSPLRCGHLTFCPHSWPLPSKFTKTKGGNSNGSTATPIPQLIPPPPQPPITCQLLSNSSWENADAPWGRDLPSLDLLDDHGKLYTDGSHEVASLLHDHGAWAGDSDEQENDSGDVELRRWSSCDSPSSPSSSSSSRSKSRSRSRSSGSSSSSISIGADLARSWKVKLVQEEDVLLARMLNSGVDKVGESKWEERERQH